MRMRLHGLKEQLNSVAYPVLTLLPEMTSEIFIYCLPSKREMDIVNPNEAPLLLTHVCRAISTPALWTIFDIYHPSSLPCLAEIAHAWFERARKCPLSEAETELALSSPFLYLGLVDLEIGGPARTFLKKLAFVDVVDGNDEDVDEADVLEILRNAAEPVTQRRSVVAGRAQLQSFRVVSRINHGWMFTLDRKSGRLYDPKATNIS
ncbi:hypothetical protein DFH08DRAFT_1071422 [Mycena albidolilacea]|uniref:Uncharacterized protein n=1 Tax=Mycena albidolilacea TaxID=1033008 RepID=A0AAD7AVI1_9AGAR|nr:hypothetical protein DFH08DRAFT_1071422 [Mycena albidolilacea]